MTVRLIATDLDGTLLNAAGEVSPRNQRALLRAADAGIAVVVATGRPARWLGVLDPLRPARPRVITSNGAAVYDLDAGRVVHSLPISASDALELVSRLADPVPGLSFAVEYAHGWGREPGYPTRPDRPDADRIAALDELLHLDKDSVDELGQPIKLLVHSDRFDTESLADQALPLLGEELTGTYSYLSEQGSLEISAAGVTKAYALAQVMAELGIAGSEVVAFGDMPNDLAMLELAGQPYVMANAHPRLLETGYPVAGDHDDSAVGRVVEDLLDRHGLG